MKYFKKANIQTTQKIKNKTIIKAFLYLRNLKKINTDYQEHLKKDTYDKPHKLKIEHTHFAASHAIGYGLNGDSKVVDFRTTVLEAEDIFLDRSTFRDDYVFIFIKTRTNLTEHKFIALKDPQGKKHTFHKADPDSIRFKVDRSVNLSTYEDLIRDLDYKPSRFTDFLKEKNWKLINIFEYTHCFSISPKYIKQTANSIEFGWLTNFTYYSHPNTLKISKVKDIKTVNLAEIGVETSGYYNHHTNMHVLPEQKDDVLKFHRRFKANL